MVKLNIFGEQFDSLYYSQTIGINIHFTKFIQIFTENISAILLLKVLGKSVRG